MRRRTLVPVVPDLAMMVPAPGVRVARVTRPVRQEIAASDPPVMPARSVSPESARAVEPVSRRVRVSGSRSRRAMVSVSRSLRVRASVSGSRRGTMSVPLAPLATAIVRPGLSGRAGVPGQAPMKEPAARPIVVVVPSGPGENAAVPVRRDPARGVHRVRPRQTIGGASAVRRFLPRSPDATCTAPRETS